MRIEKIPPMGVTVNEGHRFAFGEPRLAQVAREARHGGEDFVVDVTPVPRESIS
jgi:hypothetical protein